MLDYSLYMTAGHTLSEDTDIYGFAKTATYFEIEADRNITFNGELIDNMPVERKDWGEIKVENNPFKYKTDPSNKYKLYDLIVNSEPTVTFLLKFVYGDETLYGYFGKIDCHINEDDSIIKIKPARVDQYTDFIENYKEEVDVFGEKNLIKNGNFQVWTAGVPDGWQPVLSVDRDTLLEKDCVVISRSILGVNSILQSVAGVQQGRTILLSFSHLYIGTSETKEDLKYSVNIAGATSTYQLQSDGSWIESGTEIEITYRPNAYAIPKESAESFNLYRKVLQVAPVSGVLTVKFIGASINSNYVYITGVEVNSSDITYTTVSISLPSDNLITKPQGEIINVTTRFAPWFVTTVKSSDVRTPPEYFNEDGSPNMELLGEEKHGPHDGTGLRYPDWVGIFETDPQSSFYKGEICELILGIGHAYGWLPKKRNVKGKAKFAREEFWLEDSYDEGNNLIPPESGVGWTSTDRVDVGKRLWVRTPFNGNEGLSHWSLGELQENGNYEGFDYTQLLTSTKIYPTSSNSVEIGTGIEFRDICRKIYRSTHNSLLGKEVYSAFFWNDSPYMDFLELNGNLNYYNMKNNFLNYISVIHTSDIKQISDPALSASELKMSFKSLFDDMQVKWPSLVWFIDNDMNLHLEHHRFLDRVRSFYDISGKTCTGKYKSYEYNPEELYGNIVREESNTFYKDFKRSEEKFIRITSNKRRKDNKKEFQTRYISTDIKGALENPSELDNGMILVAYNTNGQGVNEMIYGTGQITGNNMPNGVLATPYLMREFGNYTGTWHYGYIDGQYFDYLFSKYCRTGDEIKLKGIRPENYVLTDIGMAFMESKKYDYEKEITIFKPVYRHANFRMVAQSGDVIKMDYYVDDFLAN